MRTARLAEPCFNLRAPTGAFRPWASVHHPLDRGRTRRDVADMLAASIGQGNGVTTVATPSAMLPGRPFLNKIGYFSGEGQLNSKKVSLVAAAVRPFIKPSQKSLRNVRRYSKRNRKAKDWPWNRIVHAFASNGGAYHWTEKIEPSLASYSWNALVKLTPIQRRRRLSDATNPRWRMRKGRPWLSKKFNKPSN